MRQANGSLADSYCEKGGGAPGSTSRAFIQNKQSVLTYQTHAQTYGWQNDVSLGSVSGTTGQAKRLEAIRINVYGAESGIRYRTHVQSYGWQNWVYDGENSGTIGEAKRLEAIQIELTDDLAQKYDVYYRVHAETYGWLDWAENGEPAGTEGLAKRLEAIEIRLVNKGATRQEAQRGPLSQQRRLWRTG